MGTEKENRQYQVNWPEAFAVSIGIITAGTVVLGVFYFITH